MVVCLHNSRSSLNCFYRIFRDHFPFNNQGMSLSPQFAKKFSSCHFPSWVIQINVVQELYKSIFKLDLAFVIVTFSKSNEWCFLCFFFGRSCRAAPVGARKTNLGHFQRKFFKVQINFLIKVWIYKLVKWFKKNNQPNKV